MNDNNTGGSHRNLHQVKVLYEQAEAIKRQICSNGGGDKAEQWIQRQNLQDLLHQIILK